MQLLDIFNDLWKTKILTLQTKIHSDHLLQTYNIKENTVMFVNEDI